MASRLIAGPGTLERVRAALPAKPVNAAIAYATDEAHLPLGAGDRIIVNASTRNVEAGSTSPELIGAWLAAGVDVASHEELHAKVIRSGNWTAVGSANLSAMANRNHEAVWVGNDAAVARQSDQFLTRLRREATTLDAAWVKAMAPLYGTKRPPGGATTRGQSRTSQSGRAVGRVVVWYWEPDATPPPAYVGKHLQPPRPRTRYVTTAYRVGRVADVREGDLIIWAHEQEETVESPCLVVARPHYGGKPSAWAVVTYDSWLGDDVPFADLPRTVVSKLRRENEATVESPAIRNKILRIWADKPSRILPFPVR